MSRGKLIGWIVLCVVLAGLATAAIAHYRKPAPEPGRQRRLSREEIEKLPPAEREARMRQGVERMEFRLEELRSLQALGMITDAEEQQIPGLEASIKRTRESLTNKKVARPAPSSTNVAKQKAAEDKPLSPEEREARRKQVRADLEKRLANLKAKAATNGLSAGESNQLQKMTENLARMNQRQSPKQPPVNPLPR